MDIGRSVKYLSMDEAVSGGGCKVARVVQTFSTA